MSKPQPLREALREAVNHLVSLAYFDSCNDSEWDAARTRVDVLIEQIPIVFEVHEPEEGA